MITTQSSGVIHYSDLNHYNSDIENCTFTIISVNSAEHIYLTMTHLESVECFEDMTSYSTVYVYNGPNTDSPVLGQYCGSQVPSVLISEGNALTVSINDVTSTFSATYSVVDSRKLLIQFNVHFYFVPVYRMWWCAHITRRLHLNTKLSRQLSDGYTV